MKYMLLITLDEDEVVAPEEQERRTNGFLELTQDLVQSGKMVAGEQLHPVSTATTVRVQGGEVVIADGPFAETKEQIAGFYEVECADLDEATAIAARIPAAAYGTVEVRPVVEW
ncbi:YciI family protein [Dermatobacter hominis]|uniref:YciI family protein n=1 Tax=Dermatobacter hominis TaxID=2884263 RepID=UPI001D10FC6D|nr:YciI family protein [Dermatobacter hominis]UDY37804.1 YciI family protein [Dermatobacter hominis]